MIIKRSFMLALAALFGNVASAQLDQPAKQDSEKRFEAKKD